MNSTSKEPPVLDENDYRSTEYWKPHFDDNCTISLQYYTVTDKVKILGVHAKNPNQGDKKPVIVLPGWFSLVFGWSEVIKEISKETSVIYLETREKKSSILPNRDVDMDVERMADDIIEISHLLPYEFDNCVMLGSSMGGTVIMELLSRKNRLPSHAILIGPNPEFHYPWILNIVMTFPLSFFPPIKSAIKWYIRNFRIDMEKEPQQYQKYAGTLDNAEPWKLRQSGKECLKFKIWDKIDNLELDTDIYIIGATADKMHNSDLTIRVHEALSGSHFIDFPSNKATHSAKMGEFVLEHV